MFGLVRVLGLTGAPDRPPILGRVVEVEGGAMEEFEALEVVDPNLGFRGGENSIAEPGLGRDGSMAEPGLDIAARCALMASLMDGLAPPIVLRENPRPGRTVPVASVRRGVLGLFGSFSKSFWAVGSRVSMSLYCVSPKTSLTNR